MIYDCFLFNSEIELLQLRLHYLNDCVDRFVIVESSRTLSGISKPLHFKENIQLFEKYLDKIIYLEAPQMVSLVDWDYEFFQRDYIKEGLMNCCDDDIILVSDVDEILNVKEILKHYNGKILLIELPTYYYFINLKSNVTFKVNLLAPYRLIKNSFLGNRNLYYTFTTDYILSSEVKTGWHFSYLFGLDVHKYKEKINAFSHQEFNNEYYNSSKRINKCIRNGIDLFERKFIKYSFVKKSDSRELHNSIVVADIEKYYFYPSLITLIKKKVEKLGDYTYLLSYFYKKICTKLYSKYSNA